MPLKASLIPTSVEDFTGIQVREEWTARISNDWGYRVPLSAEEPKERQTMSVMKFLKQILEPHRDGLLILRMVQGRPEAIMVSANSFILKRTRGPNQQSCLRLINKPALGIPYDGNHVWI
jgi:hypothetical protein